ncbi:MAG: TetR/AcrR family transcriptional regulator [Acidimicrobiales bacterium]
MAMPTRARILESAMRSFGGRGYEATSLDALAAELGVRKQTILYYFPSKEALLEAVIDACAADLTSELEHTLARAGQGWDRVEALVRKVFRLAARRPELLGFLREASRLGPPASTRLIAELDPLVRRAQFFLRAEMDAGTFSRHDPSIVLLTAYSMVLGVATEVEVLRALGGEPTLRSLVRRRRALESFLRGALAPEPAGGTAFSTQS